MLDVVAAVLIVVVSCSSGLVTLRADAVGSTAAEHDRRGIVESLRYQGVREQAEIEARTEERSFAAYVGARLRAAAVTDHAARDPVASVELLTHEHLAGRLTPAFREDFVRRRSPNRLADATYDTRGRVDELLRQWNVVDESGRSFAIANEFERRRNELLAAGIVLVVALALLTVAELSRHRRAIAVGSATALLAVGYGSAVVLAVGY